MSFLLKVECEEPEFQIFIIFCVFARLQSDFFNSFDILIARDEFFSSQTQQWFLTDTMHALQMLLYMFSEQFL